MGQGPMTGRGAGDCGPRQGRGFFRGLGGGSGRGLRRRRQRFGGNRGSGGGGWGRERVSESSGGDEEARSPGEADRLRAQIDVLETRLSRLEEKK
jgi:hypothetical protein